MTTEDKLSTSERRRLECLAQAIAVSATLSHSGRRENDDQIVARARTFDAFVGGLAATPAP